MVEGIGGCRGEAYAQHGQANSVGDKSNRIEFTGRKIIGPNQIQIPIEERCAYFTDLSWDQGTGAAM